MHNRTSLRYKSLLFLLSPAILGYIIYRTFKDGGWQYFSQRLGFSYPDKITGSILVHCASVGEFHAAKPLILEICTHSPKKRVVISTNTPTAAKLVLNVQSEQISHVYLPLDYSLFIKSFLNKLQPKCVLIIETEIWPNLFLSTANKNIPTAIINGRLTSKSIQGSNLLKKDYKNALSKLTVLLTRSDSDRSKFISIGANASSTYTAGNLKYAIKQKNSGNLPCTTIKRPFVLAVSTHEDEETQLAQHIEILKNKNYLLVFAPRYPERSKQLLRQFQHINIKTTLRSNQNVMPDDCDIYIVDTLGELDMYFNEAALVFVGGSLIQRGGHNILEPASFGKCIIVGPHTDNFALEIQELLEAKAIIQAADNQDIGVKFVQLLNNDNDRIQYGHNARQFIEKKSVVLSDYLKFIQPII